MKCAKSGCKEDAVGGGTYCDSHQPKDGRIEHRDADHDVEKRSGGKVRKRPGA
jgi:hypothetical protein